MSGIKIGSNISSLAARRYLDTASARLSSSFEKLSSGMRINKASDDAAGLSVSLKLSADGRVYAQALGNVNDGISALNIAQGALTQLSTIAIRQKELAEQSANGVYSLTQRRALNAEANSLVDEFNRITQSIEFNGIRLLDKSLSALRVQAGYGVDGSISFDIANNLARTVGDGTFVNKPSSASGADSVALGDLDKDGVLDMITVDYWGGWVCAFKGNGDGTFAETASYSASVPQFVTLGDVNKDGTLDMIVASHDDYVEISIGKGDGTFFSAATYSTGLAPTSVSLGDVNGDGALDMVTADYDGGTASVLIGKGDGTFFQKTSYAGGSRPDAVALGDLNGDGVLDIVTANGSSKTVSILIGNGDGTFRARTSYATGAGAKSVALGDLNRDGILDLVTADGDSAVNVLIGKGDGTFLAARSYAAGWYPESVVLGDVNGDGVVDIIAGDAGASGYGYASTVSVLLGKGDGTYFEKTSFATGSNVSTVVLGDLNGDGVLDIAAADGDNNAANVLLGSTREGVAPLLPFSLTTQAEALQALAPLDRKLNQLSAQRGVIGAFQSRLNAAINTLQSTSENYAAAESRIRDADIASEAVELARLQIGQQAAAAVLAQANIQPGLAVKLFR